MIGKGTRRSPLRAKTRIVTTDDDGRVIDLHALRTTLGTRLARAGVAPQIAQRIMRHGDYQTTLTHYTVLGLTDTAPAVGALPGIRVGEQTTRRTEYAVAPTGDDPESDPQRYPRQLGRGSRRFGANDGDNLRATGTDATDAAPTKNGPYGPSDAKRAKGLEPSTFSLEG